MKARTVALFSLIASLGVNVYLFINKTRDSNLLTPALLKSVEAMRLARSTASKTDFERGDAVGYVAALKAAGLPDRLIQMVLVATLDEASLSNFAKALPLGSSHQYWRRDVGRENVEAALIYGLSSSRNTNRLVVAKLIPYTPKEGTDTDFVATSQFALESEKALLLNQLFIDYANLETKLTLQRLPLEELRNISTFLARQKKEDIESMLTKKELEEFNVRASATARSLRSATEYYNLTEAEFRYIVEKGAELNPYLDSNAGEHEPQEALQLLRAEVEKTLGADRAKDFWKKSDIDYRIAMHTIRDLGLPDASADALVNIQKEFQSRVTILRRQFRTTPDAIARQMTETQKEAELQVTDVLGGAKGLQSYRAHGALWIDRIFH